MTADSKRISDPTRLQKKEMDQERPHMEIFFIKDFFPNAVIIFESDRMDSAEAAAKL